SILGRRRQINSSIKAFHCIHKENLFLSKFAEHAVPVEPSRFSAASQNDARRLREAFGSLASRVRRQIPFDHSAAIALSCLRSSSGTASSCGSRLRRRRRSKRAGSE